MRVAIYKPFKKVFFHANTEDYAGWSYEVVNIAKVLERNGHLVYIVSETDLQHGDISNIIPGSIDDSYDRIIFMCGVFNEHEILTAHKLRTQTERLDFVLTDLKLQPDAETYELFDNVYTQSPIQIESIPVPQKYSGTCELKVLDFEFPDSIEESIANKDIGFYFGGGERGRLDEFIEYVWRPGHEWHARSDFFGVENRIEITQHMTKVKLSKYSVVIADVIYNMNSFVTPRPYECFMSDVVAFTPDSYDNQGIIIPKEHYLRVSSFKDMHTKMQELNSNPEKLIEILTWQREQIKRVFVTGEYTYAHIK